MQVSLFEKIKTSLSEFKPEILSAENLYKYHDIFRSNNDYYLLTDGHPITDEDMQATVEYGKVFTGGNVLSVGFQFQNNAVAFLSAIEQYPEPDTLYIGLFLVDERYKRKHIGSQIITGIKTAVKELHFQKLKLSVLKKNTNGCLFWESLGFKEINNIDDNLSMECSLENNY